MFCPECRRHWSAPTDSKETGLVSKIRPNKVPTTCTNCGALLARDRLVAEFPETGQAQQAARGVRERRITIQDILRETANPDSFANVGDVVPLDEQQRRAGGFRWRWMRGRNAGVADSYDNPPFLKLASLDIALGIAALAAMVIFISTVIMRANYKATHTMATASRAHIAPVKPAIPANELGGSALVSLMPAIVGSGWKRWEPANALVPTDVSDSEQTLASTYADGSQLVYVSIAHYPSDADADAAYQVRSTEPYELHVTGGVEAVSPHTVLIDGNAVQESDARANTVGAYAVNPLVPGAILLPHTALWRSGTDVLTVSSANAVDRDGFLASYIKS